jgi:glycine cleavage system H protein
MKVPEDYLYTEEHEWVRRENGEALVGITAYATGQLGGITFIDLPSEGQQISQASPFAEVESVKAVSDIYAPASGTVVEVHEELAEHPELIDRGPYESGWICRIELQDSAELNSLMDAVAYAKYVEDLEQ